MQIINYSFFLEIKRPQNSVINILGRKRVCFLILYLKKIMLTIFGELQKYSVVYVNINS